MYKLTHRNIVPLLLLSVGAEKNEFAVNLTGIFMQSFSLDYSLSSGVCYYFRFTSPEYYCNLWWHMSHLGYLV